MNFYNILIQKTEKILKIFLGVLSDFVEVTLNVHLLCYVIII